MSSACGFRPPQRGPQESSGMLRRTTYFNVAGSRCNRCDLFMILHLQISWKGPSWSTHSQTPSCVIASGQVTAVLLTAPGLMPHLLPNCFLGNMYQRNCQQQQSIRVACLHTCALTTLSVFQHQQKKIDQRKFIMIFIYISWTETIIFC